MDIEVPEFGLLLAKHIGKIPEASQPAFLSRLERTAAAQRVTHLVHDIAILLISVPSA